MVLPALVGAECVPGIGPAFFRRVLHWARWKDVSFLLVMALVGAESGDGILVMALVGAESDDGILVMALVRAESE